MYDEKLSSYFPLAHILLSTQRQDFYETIWFYRINFCLQDVCKPNFRVPVSLFPGNMEENKWSGFASEGENGHQLPGGQCSDLARLCRSRTDRGVFCKITKAFQSTEYLDLFAYYRKTWLEDINVKIWNQSTRLREDDSFKTTNNALESFHNQILLNCYKVSLIFFISLHWCPVMISQRDLMLKPSWTHSRQSTLTSWSGNPGNLPQTR